MPVDGAADVLRDLRELSGVVEVDDAGAEVRGARVGAVLGERGAEKVEHDVGILSSVERRDATRGAVQPQRIREHSQGCGDLAGKLCVVASRKLLIKF